MLWAGRLAYWVGWPGIHIILSGSKRTRIIMLADGGQCLAVKPYLGSGAWKLPGGGVHKSETLTVAASRELFEEVGVHTTPDEFEHLGDAEMNENGHRYHAHFLAVRVKKPETLRLQWWEISEAVWRDFETTANAIDNPAVRQALQVWAQR